MEKKMKIYNPRIYIIDFNFYMKGKDKLLKLMTVRLLNPVIILSLIGTQGTKKPFSTT